MPTPHLLPADVELLLDDEAGPALASLRAHVEQCAACQSMLAVERDLLDLLEHVPHVAPTASFQDRVMARVEVFEPWHVSLRDTAQRLVPPPGPWRWMIGAGLVGGMATVTALVVWVALRFDRALYLWHLAVERTQASIIAGVGRVIQLALGDAASSAVLVGGLPAAVVALVGIAATLGAATFGLRGLVAVARRRRN
jgi:hypothetical protein